MLAFSSNKFLEREITRLGSTRLDASLEHVMGFSGREDSVRKACKWCAFKLKTRSAESKSEDSAKHRAPRTYYRCLGCDVPLCEKKGCFQRYHEDEETILEVFDVV